MSIRDVGIIFVNIIAIVVIVMILVYLAQDRRRFRVERQFKAVRALFDEWVSLASALPGCGELAAEYEKTGNISKKYGLISRLIAVAHGRETVRMAAAAEKLGPFCHVYAGLAESYNQHLIGRVREPVMRFLGFEPLPPIHFETAE